MTKKSRNLAESKIVISESVYDFKYQSIFENIDNLEVVESSFLHSLIILIKNPKRVIYHIRYIKYDNIFKSFFRLI